MNTDLTPRKIALGAMLAGAVTLATMLHVPMPGLRIYFNLGEGVIYTVAILLGPRYGALSGSIGASLADLILGYPLWAPITFVIKGLEGFLVGSFAPKGKIFGIAVGAMVMIAGYTTTAGILYGWKVAPMELLTDVLQTGVGALFALMFVPIIEKRLSRKSVS